MDSIVGGAFRLANTVLDTGYSEQQRRIVFAEGMAKPLMSCQLAAAREMNDRYMLAASAGGSSFSN
jgi:hypothetical protein